MKRLILLERRPVQGPSDKLAAEIFSNALPTEDAVLYGSAALEPRGAFEARGLQTFKLTYTTGRYGLDDTGSIRIVFRFTADGGPLQTTDPAALNYVTAKSSNGVPLQANRDNPLWIRVTTEDGFQAWTSPVYVFRS